MLIVRILFCFVLGIILAELNYIYIPVALFLAAGIYYLLAERNKQLPLFLIVVALSDIMALEDRTFPNEEHIIRESKAFCLISERIDSLQLSEESKAFAHGILLGDKTAIGKVRVQSMRDAGLSHIMAVSGLHIGIIYFIIFILLMPLRWMNYHRSHRFAVMMAVWIYVMIIGFPISAVRAALMITVMCLSWVLERYAYNMHILASAALIILLWDTQQLWNVGFQLSFMATAGILMSVPVHEKLNKVWRMIVVTVSAQIMTLPIVACYFHIIPVMGWIQGLIVVPVLSLLIYIMILYIAFPVLSFMQYPIDILVRWIYWVADITSEFEAWVLGGRLVVYPTFWEAAMMEAAGVAIIYFLVRKSQERRYSDYRP